MNIINYYHIIYEVSTRTSCSFSSAMQRLGGSVIYMDEYSSSAKKGETIEDAVQVRGPYRMNDKTN